MMRVFERVQHLDHVTQADGHPLGILDEPLLEPGAVDEA